MRSTHKGCLCSCPRQGVPVSTWKWNDYDYDIWLILVIKLQVYVNKTDLIGDDSIFLAC